MRTIISKLNILVIALVMSACADYLDTEPKDFSRPEDFMKTEKQVETVVNGVYNNIDFSSDDNLWLRVYPMYYDVMTDNAFNRSPWEGATDFARGTVTAENFRVEAHWKRNYSGIARANAFLDAIEKSTLISNKIPRYIAEVKFLRAWYYHDLVNFFGDVPLILDAPDLENKEPARTAKADIIAQIIEDLNDIIPILPESYDGPDDQGRITRGAAYSFLSRVYLYDKQWVNAAKAAQDCMDLGKYSLYSDYEGLFLEENEVEVSGTEAIFEVHYTPQINPSFFQMPLMEWWPSFLPTLELAESYYMANGLPITDPNSGYDPENPYMNRDPRLEASIYYPGAPWTIEFWGRVNLRFEENWILGGSGFKPKKWINNGKALDRTKSEGTNKLFIRYAEVLLNYAEAQNEAAGPDMSVYAAIDELRVRAGMTTLTNAMPGLSKDEMRDVIRNERRIEFVFEGHRLNDIRRWGIMEDVMKDVHGYDATYLQDMSYPGDGMGTTDKWQYKTKVLDIRSFNSSRDYVWPIPREEMNSNTNMKQNNGYN
ncbi:RagB/SusD family nutrient uptake outer membrane protein [Carboxylicivirga sediminis]|uniref:RagB/SusD family nutrient uptake outer membrane protein n=1 Tax=Carboxylicivirga sediminis TaxID=2006564 RepID=A0A941F332_9BACT|nr:RagB/SusD family nutrient uptake outer membrane protein [Carboxylicivirga sediminis]MBR8535896.1 RagB/SusD family nutrient uptake outer membrane protein [Carboxylicivirga sediminis]